MNGDRVTRDSLNSSREKNPDNGLNCLKSQTELYCSSENAKLEARLEQKEHNKALLIWGEQVGRLPLQKAVKVSEDSTIKDVIKIMRKKKSGCVLIMDNKSELAGLFTERDLMKKYVGTPLSPETPIKEVMTRDPLTLPEKTTVSQAIYFMGEKHFRHLPICDKNNKVKGLLSVRVLVYFIAEHLPGEVLNLPPDEKALPRKVEGG